jgi:GGDEF domain-containing protein
MATITEMQISAARYANPLTQLPGNVPINEHVDRMLSAASPFVAVYIDIDDFKPFNDTFGYRRGDDVIQLLARLLCEATDERLDFVGHIGGDDFFVIFRSADWEMRCWQLIAGFGEAANLLGVDERLRGGYMAENRRGELSPAAACAVHRRGTHRAGRLRIAS